MTIEGVVVSPRQVSSSSSIIIGEAAERLQDEAAEARHALGHEVEGAEAAREVQAADEGAAGLQRRFWSFLMAKQAVRALARAEALWQGSARLVGAFWVDSRIRYAAVAQW